MNTQFRLFQQKISNPLAFRLFMLRSLPAAFFAGLRIRSLDPQKAVITARYKWYNRNPFGSMYFAVQSMVAEMSTGLLVSGHVYKQQLRVSLIVVGIEARFVKKVTGRVFFACSDGDMIAATVQAAIGSADPKTIICHSIGTDGSGDIVSEFWVTWSFKAKHSNNIA